MGRSQKELMKAKGEFIKEWSDLIVDLANGELQDPDDDMDLGVGLDMAVHLAVLLDRDEMDHAQQLLSLLDQHNRLDFEVSSATRDQLIQDAKELFPRRFI